MLVITENTLNGVTSTNDIATGVFRQLQKMGAKFLNSRELYFRAGQAGLEVAVSSTLAQMVSPIVLIFQAADAMTLRLDFLADLRHRAFVVMVLGDSEHHFFDRDVYYGQAVDLIVTYDELMRHWFWKYKIPAISFLSSFDGAIYRNLECTQDIDICFVGRLLGYPVRQEAVRRIALELGGQQGLESGFAMSDIPLEEMVRVFNRTKINLNFSGVSQSNMFATQRNISTRLSQLKGRMMEIALCGGFVLTEYAPGLESVFIPEVEVATFKTLDELIHKARYYLSHESERLEIARCGYERATRDYELSRAIPNLLGRIEEHRKTKASAPLEKIVLDPAFSRNYAATRLAWMLHFFIDRRYRLASQELCACIKSGFPNVRFAFRCFVRLQPRFQFLKRLYGYFRDTAAKLRIGTAD